MRLDLAILDVDQRDLFHFDAALTVFGIDPERRRAVLADAKVIVRQIAAIRPPAARFRPLAQRNPSQKRLMRAQASVSAASEVA